jgi:hypothetical protein
MINLDEFDGHTHGPWQEDGGGWMTQQLKTAPEWEEGSAL